MAANADDILELSLHKWYTLFLCHRFCFESYFKSKGETFFAFSNILNFWTCPDLFYVTF